MYACNLTGTLRPEIKRLCYYILAYFIHTHTQRSALFELVIDLFFLPLELEEAIVTIYPVPGNRPVTVKAARLIFVVLATVK